MKNIIPIFLVFCFSISTISCAKRDGSSDTTIWSETKQIGTSIFDHGIVVTLESSENLFESEQTNTGLGGSTNLGSDDIFLVNYNSSGKKRWTEQVVISEDKSGISLAVDSFDNIYVTGYTKVETDGDTSSGNYRIFMIKYNSSGIKQWTKQLGYSATNNGMGMTVDSFDNIYVTGFANRVLDGNINLGGEDIVLMKYNSFGTKQWAKQLRISESDFAFDVTVGTSDNIHLIGFTNSNFDENFDHLSDVFFVKYNSDGIKQ